jgi:hypothetical protein
MARIGFISLGCAKNQVDCERMMYRVQEAGHEVTMDPAGCDVVVSNKVKLEDGVYYNPIIKLNNDAETEDDLPAITYFLKRGNLVEHKRHVGVGDEIVCTAHGMPALTNESKVVILKTKA